jgi:hypothetical protein
MKHSTMETRVRTTERRIELLETVDLTAVNNDDGKPGEFWPKCARFEEEE